MDSRPSISRTTSTIYRSPQRLHQQLEQANHSISKNEKRFAASPKRPEQPILVKRRRSPASPSRQEQDEQTTLKKRKRSSVSYSLETHTSSPSSSATPPNTGSNLNRPSISRSDTFASGYDEGNPNKWTRGHWRMLEAIYIRRKRNYLKAGNEFYYKHSLQSIVLPSPDDASDGKPVTNELWTKEHVVWRARCLDTCCKAHNGVLPSEVKRVSRMLGSCKSTSDPSVTNSTSSADEGISKAPSERAPKIPGRRRPHPQQQQGRNT